MWDSLLHYMSKFNSAVLTSLDAVGCPFSVRCQPQPDSTVRVLRLSLPEDTPLRPGPACLLFHKHDDRLWNLLSFVVRGTLEREGQGWILRPAQFVPGVGIGGLMSYVRFLVNGRRTTSRYLRKRGLARPRIAWHEWQEVFDQAKETG
jgi:hypothetical protein